MEKICMNEACKATATSSEWKRGWALKSGGFANLCYGCGSAYENSLYCESFHLKESGWRECLICGKRIHCGCIVSKDLHDYLDSGGVTCLACSKELENLSSGPSKVPNGDILNGSSFNIDKEKSIQINEVISESAALIQKSKSMVENNVLNEHTQREGTSTVFAPQSTLGLSLTTPSFTTNTLEKNEPSKVSLFQQGQRADLSFPKLSRCGQGSASETRVPRPPADIRGRSQLLPRYWPRITDEELDHISEELNSRIVPLFEKVLSASDAGRIGRLVLPKACAEAYFPPILQSDGIPIRVQDIKGNEWKLQFRFWPNNNSRMYVLEGVTPCIQNMNLEAGDVVTFSRIEPGGQLVMGFRKKINPIDMQDHQPPVPCNSSGSGKASLPGANENLQTDGKGTNGNRSHENNLIPKKKKMRNIGAKSKRFHPNSEDSVELTVTWEEAQEMFRPSPKAKPNIVMIDNQAIEEYEEPPIFGKRTIFTSGASGNQDQWTQCDSCCKWRKLPIDFLVPPKWTCSENIWDPSRRSCSAIGEMNRKELEDILRSGSDFKKQRIAKSSKTDGEEASGLYALANAAFPGENTEGLGEPSSGPTTRHPRHRPGCTCIVCIQPPSGKAKHKPTCTCNVCSTVKRRFTTFMLRKKKREAERKAESDLQKENATENGFSAKSFKISMPDLNCDPNEDMASIEKCVPSTIENK